MKLNIYTVMGGKNWSKSLSCFQEVVKSEVRNLQHITWCPTQPNGSYGDLILVEMPDKGLKQEKGYDWLKTSAMTGLNCLGHC